jgi:hypothetical protein
VPAAVPDLPCHPALGSDTVDARVAPRRREPARIAGSIAVVNEPEVELGIAAELRRSGT